MGIWSSGLGGVPGQRAPQLAASPGPPSRWRFGPRVAIQPSWSAFHFVSLHFYQCFVLKLSLSIFGGSYGVSSSVLRQL